MSDTTMNVQDIEDETRNENLVRDYLLNQLQLNLLHAQWQDKVHAEVVEELMEAKRIMQEMEDDVVKKFFVLNEQYEQINGIIDSEKVRELENHQEMLKKIEDLSIKQQTILDAFNNDARACLTNYQVRAEQLEQLEEEIRNQKEVVAALDACMSAVDFELRFS
ncbi:Tripeptidyl-peptidase [Dirofilaria immitis]